MNRKAAINVWAVLFIAVAAILGIVLAIWGVSAAIAAVIPVVPVEYDGEFDAVAFLTTTEECFAEDIESQAFREDTTNDKWTGNGTMTNFTGNSQFKKAPLYFEIDGGDMEALSDITIDEVAGTIVTNLTLTSVKLYEYRECDKLTDFSDDIEDGELDVSYDLPIERGKYILDIEIKSTDLAANHNVTPAAIYKVKIEGKTTGDVADIEADIIVGQKT